MSINLNSVSLTSIVKETTSAITNDGKIDKNELNSLKNSISKSDLPSFIKEGAIKFISKVSQESNGFLGFGQGLSNKDISQLKAFANTLPKNELVDKLQSSIEALAPQKSDDSNSVQGKKSSWFSPNSQKFPSPNANAAKVAIDTSKMSTEEKFSFYENLTKQKGGTLNLKPEARNIVSLRVPTNPDANGGKGIYNDKTAVLWVDKNGKKHVEEFVSNLDPSGQYAGNGFRSDSGRIKSGNYKFEVSKRDNGADCLRPVSTVGVERFRNGEFKSTSERNDHMLFHQGAEGNTQSAGCQTMDPSEWQKFWSAVSGGSNSESINYTIVNT